MLGLKLSAQCRGSSVSMPKGGSGSVLSHTVATHTSHVHLYKHTDGGKAWASWNGVTSQPELVKAEIQKEFRYYKLSEVLVNMPQNTTATC